MSWFLPPGASTFAGDIDWLYYMILIMTGIAFVVVEVGILWFLFAYRSRPGRKALYYHGNNRAEVIWTSVTAIAVVATGLLSAGVWNDIKGRDSVPAGAMLVGIRAQQFEWHFKYPGPDGQLGTADDDSTRNQLHIPVDTPIVAVMTSDDAIHSFFVPAFRIKQDAVPGMTIRVWFHATKAGKYEIACAELCGLGHYRMKAMVTVYAKDEYERWLGDTSRRSASASESRSEGARPVAMNHEGGAH